MIREVVVLLAGSVAAQALAMTDAQLHDVLQRLNGSRTGACMAAAVLDAVIPPGPGNEQAVLMWLQEGPASLARSLSAATSPALTTAQLERYVGEYPMFGQFVITISVHDGRLHAQGTGQAGRDLQAVAEDVFVYEPVSAEFRFERDATGQVVAMTLLQSGEQVRGVRR